MTRPKLPLILRTISLTLLVGLQSGCYLATQAGYFLGDQMTARPVHRVDADPRTAAETRDFLALVRDILDFAEQEIGLDRSSNFTRYIATERTSVAYVVSATREFSFQTYRRRFPFVGEVPYLGFYRRPAADRFAAQLMNQGYDVWVRGVGAFSTLGYFSDPLYSYMADYPLHRLANMLIHELAHATLWIPGEVGFNEQYATIIGDEGARQYILSRHGAESEHYRRLEDTAVDAVLFRADILELRSRLAELYADSDMDEETMRQAKQSIISDHQNEFAETYDERYRTEGYRRYPELEVNNAYLSLFGLYTQDLSSFYHLYELLGFDLSALVDAFRELPSSDLAPDEYLQSLIFGS
ncbi:MAG: aminopeptidase [Spirochaetaceae bacterium]|nr:MAG: aminopeptidase [Spirochaetaceae bacterium]